MSSYPPSYNDLHLPQILVSHHPPSSPTPTPIVIITLHRPANQNAFTGEMVTSLVTILGYLSHDPRVRCIVFTGHGRVFCAGADLSIGFTTSDTYEDHRDGGGKVALALQNCRKPVIGAINGSAVGVGITMTLPMNIRIVAKTAKIGFVFARRGIAMEACSNFYLPRLVGYGRAMHLVTTGEVVPATSPLLEGLFSEVVDTERVLKRALEIAEEVVKNTSVVSTHLMKDMIWRGPDNIEESQLLVSKILIDLYKGPEKDEGVNSFLEKRQVNFKGTMDTNAPRVWPWWKEVDVSVSQHKKDKAKL